MGNGSNPEQAQKPVSLGIRKKARKSRYAGLTLNSRRNKCFFDLRNPPAKLKKVLESVLPNISQRSCIPPHASTEDNVIKQPASDALAIPDEPISDRNSPTNPEIVASFLVNDPAALDQDIVEHVASDELTERLSQGVTNTETLSDQRSAGSRVGIPVIIALLMIVFDKHALTHDAKDDLLRLIGNVFFDKVNLWPLSYEALKRMLIKFRLLDTATEWFFCPDCGRCGGQTSFECDDPACKNGAQNLDPKASALAKKRKEEARFCYIPFTRHIRERLEAGKLKPLKDFAFSHKDPLAKFIDSKICQKLRSLTADDDILPILLTSDGAATSRSSTASIWLSQFKVLQPGYNEPWNVLTCWPKTPLFCIKSKWHWPSALMEGLNTPFIEEVLPLHQDGLSYILNGVPKRVRIIVVAVIADNPERAKILNIGSQHCLFGCCHCEIKGVRFEFQSASGKNCSKKVFPVPMGNLKSASLRDLSRMRKLAADASLVYGQVRSGIVRLTVKGLRKKKQELRNVEGPSWLQMLPHFDETRLVPPEPMHLIFEGIFKDFLELFISGPWKLSGKELRWLDSTLSAIQQPSCFQRSLRPITRFKEFKANEFHQLCMYALLPAISKVTVGVGRAVICQFIMVNQYLFSGEYTETGLNEMAATMIQIGRTIEEHLGMSYMSYNLHQWCFHLVPYIKLLGPPSAFWAFESEGNIKRVKRYLTCANEQGKELSGKILFGQAAQRMMQIFVENSEEKDVSEVSAFLTRSKRAFSLTVTSGSSKVRLTGASKPLRSLEHKFPEDYFSLNRLLKTAFNETVNVELFSGCCAENGVFFAVMSEEGTERINSFVRTKAGTVLLVRNILVAWKSDRDGEKVITLVHGSPIKSTPRHFFNFDGRIHGETRNYTAYFQLDFSELMEDVLIETAQIDQLLYFIRIDDECFVTPIVRPVAQ